MSVFYKKDLNLDLINSMIEYDDINDIKSLKYWLNKAMDDEFSLDYYYDDIGYGMDSFSNLECDIVEYNSISMPIGYHKDLIANILKNKYDDYDIWALNDLSMLKLWHIHLFNSKYDAILNLIKKEYFKAYNSSDMAFKYLKNSLESNINEIEKIRLLLFIVGGIDD